LRQLRLSLGLDTHHAHAHALLAGEVCQQALHPAGGAGTLGGEEDEQRLVVTHPFPPEVGRLGEVAADVLFPANEAFKRSRHYTGLQVGSWYWIGVCAGLGVALGVLLAGLFAGTRIALTAALVLAAGVGVAIGFALGQWDEAIGGGAGGALGDGRAPALSFLAEHGRYSRAVSTFPSLTPVCLSSIATGAHPDVHHIPHLVWYDRERARIIEYGSSFAALRAAGMARSILDAIINMNRLHLSPDAVTVYEALDDAGFTTAAVNITCYRGRTRHLPTLPGVTIPAYGPKRFFFYNLFESDPTGAPLAVFGRAQGSIDGYAAAVGRWLVTRDGFDFLVYYLPDYDFASHVHGPDGAYEALARSDAAVGALLDAAGGPE